MRQSLLTILMLVVVTLRVTAQPSIPNDVPRAHYGIFFGLNLTQHFASFRALPRVPSCCPEYDGGSGTGIAAGLLMDYPFTPKVLGSLRAGYYSAGGTLASTEKTRVIVNGADVPGEFEHTIEADLGYLGIQPMLGFRLSDAFRFYAGGRLGFITTYNFHQSERIIRPENTGTFDNGLRIRNDTSGTIESILETQMALVAGLALQLPVNRDATFRIVPEIFYTLAVTPVTRSLSWHLGALQLGFSLHYSPPTEPLSAPVAVTPPVATPTDTISTSTIMASVSASGVGSDGRPEQNVTLRIEEFISTHMRPLLPYIFFGDNSSALPRRYRVLPPSAAGDFHVADLHSVATLPTYHHALNIIGRRMREHPRATITLVGCNSDRGEEKGRAALSRARAEAVREYLRDIWGIAQERMQVEARNLPEKPTNPNDPDGVAENRRVEIVTETWEILEPVITDDTLRTATPPTIRFTTDVQSDAATARWTLTAMQSGRRLKQFSGEGPVPAAIDWQIDAEQSEIPRAPEPITYELRVIDREGNQYVTPTGSLPVEQITLRRKRVERIADREIDRYSLILFDFDRADLNGPNRRITNFIRSRITPSASVTITGHSDRIGEAEYNRRLSHDRARNVASALSVPESNARGEGESSPPFDNDLPEGRFYSRTVGVVVETSVANP